MNLNHAEVIASFRNALEAVNGPLPGEVVADGEIHRYRTDKDKRGSLNGWYVLYLDGIPSGAFGNWKTGHQETWCAVDREQMTHEERATMVRHAENVRQQQEQARKDRACRQDAVAMKVKTWWHWARPADPSHGYLQTKHVAPYGLRQDNDDGALLVPLTTDGESWVNLQRIWPNGSKRFVAGGRVRGCYSPIAGEQGDANGPLYVCEGWATGATIRALTGHPVACAMNCGNLRPVAELLRQRYPDRPLIIAGDNDHHTEGNPGKTAAQETAQAVGAEWMVPDFPGGLPGTDYNDRYLLELEGRL